jgi:hypothetical protein
MAAAVAVNTTLISVLRAATTNVLQATSTLGKMPTKPVVKKEDGPAVTAILIISSILLGVTFLYLVMKSSYRLAQVRLLNQIRGQNWVDRETYMRRKRQSLRMQDPSADFKNLKEISWLLGGTG